MQTTIRRLSHWAYRHHGTPVSRWRRQRLGRFLELVAPGPRARIIDLGGSAEMWSMLAHDFPGIADFEICIVNLPGGDEPDVSPNPNWTVSYGDACDLRAQFSDRSFDIAFSNSVIEHVGNAARRQRFAAEVVRLAPAFWIQTPSDRFPIEVHTCVPYYFRLPPPIRSALQRRWELKLPEWSEMVKSTTVVTRAEMARLFPNAQVYVEHVLGFEKSYSFYRAFTPNSADARREARGHAQAALSRGLRHAGDRVHDVAGDQHIDHGIDHRPA
jgi:hypothetical protein